MWNDRVYGEFGAYRSAPLGIQRPLDSTATGVISGAAPYWRVAFPNVWGQNYLYVGTYGIAASVYPAGVAGPTNRFTDVAVDLAYMHSFGSNSFTLDGTWIHEKQTWTAGGAANPTNTLRTFRMDAMYHIGTRYAFTLAPFVTTGTSDTLLYAPAPVVGSRTGSPKQDRRLQARRRPHRRQWRHELQRVRARWPGPDGTAGVDRGPPLQERGLEPAPLGGGDS